jgi:hypothetical protein
MGLRPAWIQTSLRLDPCGSHTHYVGFVMTRLIFFLSLAEKGVLAFSNF